MSGVTIIKHQLETAQFRRVDIRRRFLYVKNKIYDFIHLCIADGKLHREIVQMRIIVSVLTRWK